MAPAKRRRPVMAERTLSADMLLEIVARSDHVTLVRCAAACKSIRREILDPSFVRRVCTNEDGAAIIPPRVLAYLHNRKQEPPLVSLVHPVTPVASSFTDASLAPFMLRRSLDIPGSYEPLLSRGGLVLLHRQHTIGIGTSITRMSRRCNDLCVFDPFTGDRTYLSCLSGLFPDRYVLLTAADGIGCCFRLLATNVDRCNESGGLRITVQATKKAGDASWGPVTKDTNSLLPFRPLQPQRDPVVLHGGIIHWLLLDSDIVLTYDICTSRQGMVKLPPTNYAASKLHLGMSPDGRRLRLLGTERFMVSVWVQLPDGWVKEAVISLEHKLQSLHPRVFLASNMSIQLKYWGERSGMVLLQAYRWNRLYDRRSLIVLDLGTKETRKINLSQTSLLFEIDLSMRLQGMKIY